MKKILGALIIAFISLALVLLVVEMVLKHTDLGPAIEYNDLNDSINTANHEFAALNPYGFTDIVRDTVAADSIYRIAVIGDSYIWGDGLAYNQVWSHKLEDTLKKYCKNVELLSWGKNGWSTLDQIGFIKDEGYKYHPDLIIIGYVQNDPDPGIPVALPQRTLKFISSFSKYLPHTTAMLSVKIYINRFLDWMELIYSDENLSDYSKTIEKLSILSDSLGFELLVIMTPNTNHGDEGYFETIGIMMKEANIKYLNLMPAAIEELKEYSYQDLMANPVNGHPGDIMTEFLADKSFNYLKQEGYLKGCNWNQDLQDLQDLLN